VILDANNTIYIGLDGTNGEVKVLIPRKFKADIVELKLDDRNPESTDAAEFRMLESEMDCTTYQL